MISGSFAQYCTLRHNSAHSLIAQITYLHCFEIMTMCFLVLLLLYSEAKGTSTDDIQWITSAENMEFNTFVRHLVEKSAELESKISSLLTLRQDDKRKIDALSKMVDSLLEHKVFAENRIYDLENATSELRRDKELCKSKIESLEETVKHYRKPTAYKRKLGIKLMKENKTEGRKQGTTDREKLNDHSPITHNNRDSVVSGNALLVGIVLQALTILFVAKC